VGKSSKSSQFVVRLPEPSGNRFVGYPVLVLPPRRAATPRLGLYLSQPQHPGSLAHSISLDLCLYLPRIRVFCFGISPTDPWSQLDSDRTNLDLRLVPRETLTSMLYVFDEFSHRDSFGAESRKQQQARTFVPECRRDAGGGLLVLILPSSRTVDAGVLLPYNASPLLRSRFYRSGFH